MGGPVMGAYDHLTEEYPARDRAEFITDQVEKIDRIEGQLARMESMLIRIEERSCNVVAPMAWRPIVSAPRDGTRILARTGRFVNIVSWDDGLGWTDEEARDLEHPEYWMPLPELHDSLP
jgi:hypothetical protein